MDRGEAPREFLACIKPRVLMWLNWFRRTQKANGLFSFKWSGRVKTDGIWHTLSSGLDDYPRSKPYTKDPKPDTIERKPSTLDPLTFAGKP